MAPVTGKTLYVFELLEQIETFPLIMPGCGSTVPPEIVTASVLGEDEPQESFALTVIFPPVAPAVSVIEFVVELPVHPEGNVHVYDVAPFTGETL